MHASRNLLVLVLVAGCSLSPEVAGNADVTGQVIQSSGLPLANSSVAIDCGAGATKTQVPTDAAGRYGANLSAPTPVSSRCMFGVPDLVNPRIRLDTSVGFSPVGQLHPLQFVDLREPTAP